MEDKRSDLHRAKVGVAVLAATFVKTLEETDPSFKERFLSNLRDAYHKLRDDTDGNVKEQMEMLDWTREMLTGWNAIHGQGEPFFPE